jgi:hypothetical protein
MPFEIEQRVAIVAGSYRGRRGTYLAPAGFYGLSGKVRVDGDSRLSRTLRLTSLEAIEAIVIPPLPSPPRRTPATTGARSVSPEPLDSMQDVIEEARAIQRRVTDLVIRLEALTVAGRAP